MMWHPAISNLFVISRRRVPNRLKPMIIARSDFCPLNYLSAVQTSRSCSCRVSSYSTPPRILIPGNCIGFLAQVVIGIARLPLKLGYPTMLNSMSTELSMESSLPRRRHRHLGKLSAQVSITVIAAVAPDRRT